VGIAWAAVASQVYTLIAFSVILTRAGLNPFGEPRLRWSPAGGVADLATASAIIERDELTKPLD
jgi:hypothetical protein